MGSDRGRIACLGLRAAVQSHSEAGLPRWWRCGQQGGVDRRKARGVHDRDRNTDGSSHSSNSSGSDTM
eukprot:SAG22_NODE_8206_length_675_cov_0.703125_1_plen_67_part_10